MIFNSFCYDFSYFLLWFNHNTCNDNYIMIYSQQRGRDRIFRLERGDRMGQQTSKKVKFVGTEQFINTATGELTEMQVTSIEDRDFNFTKIWMKNFIATMDIVGNQKTRFCYWIIDHLNRDNILIGTQRKLSEKSGISLQTVNLTMKLLMDADFLRKQSSGVYSKSRHSIQRNKS